MYSFSSIMSTNKDSMYIYLVVYITKYISFI